LLFVDGHSDFYDSNLSGTGEIAEMDLGIVTGFGHDVLANLSDMKPYFRPEDVVVFRGMTVTIYNPKLDDTGDAGKVLTRLLASGLDRPRFEI
jgi:hypothetical protein